MFNFIPLCAFLGLGLSLLSCQKEGPQSLNFDALQAELTRSQGYRISRFIEEGRDYTTSFQAYRLIFEEDGSLTVLRQTQRFTGTYELFQDDGQTEIRLQIPQPNELKELNDDWYLRSRSAESIVFEDQNDVLVLTPF